MSLTNLNNRHVPSNKILEAKIHSNMPGPRVNRDNFSQLLPHDFKLKEGEKKMNERVSPNGHNDHSSFDDHAEHKVKRANEMKRFYLN